MKTGIGGKYTMKRLIPILLAMILVCGPAVISGCDKGEGPPDKAVEAVKPAPPAEATRPADTDTSDDFVPSDETDIQKDTDIKTLPDIIEDQGGIIEMKNEAAVSQHRMGIVRFTHEKHYRDQPEGHGIGCGECHHGAAGIPLAELKPGDTVQNCLECHSKKDRPKKPQDISDADWLAIRLEYYVEAMHDNCIKCHKEQGGPVKCADCHPRPEQ
jgi:hypothetical protein